MRRISILLLLGLALLIGGASASADDRGHKKDRDDRLRLVAVSDQLKDFDLAPAGESIGDYFVFSDKVYDRERQVGYLDGVCTATRVEAAASHQQCVVTLTLRKGQLTSQGVIRFDEDFDGEFTFAITGGTHRYDDAAGDVRVTFVSETETHLDIDLDD